MRARQAFLLFLVTVLSVGALVAFARDAGATTPDTGPYTVVAIQCSQNPHTVQDATLREGTDQFGASIYYAGNHQHSINPFYHTVLENSNYDIIGDNIHDVCTGGFPFTPPVAKPQVHPDTNTYSYVTYAERCSGAIMTATDHNITDAENQFGASVYYAAAHRTQSDPFFDVWTITPWDSYLGDNYHYDDLCK